MNRMHAGAQPAKGPTHNDHAMAKVARCTDLFNVLPNTKPHSRVVGWWNENKSVLIEVHHAMMSSSKVSLPCKDGVSADFHVHLCIHACIAG